MEELIEFVAKSLVDDAEAVNTHVVRPRRPDRASSSKSRQTDLGKVIGRQGRTARAMRTLLSAAGQKSRRRYILDIVD